MYDLLALAFQTDSTRVVSFAVAPEGANRPMPHLDIAEGYHFLTHHAGNKEKILKVAKIERWYMEQFARFLAKLDGMKEADGTSVLDNSMIVYGCAIGDGNRHNHDDLPVVLAGGGGGTLRPGRHLKVRTGHADDQPVRVAAGPDGGEGRAGRRQHREARRRVTSVTTRPRIPKKAQQD